MPRLFTRPGLHTGAFYLALFMATGVIVPFWPLWLSDWGLTAAEVSAYTALGIAVRVVAGLLIPALADRLDRRRATIAVCAVLSVVIFLAHLGITRRPTLLVATLAAGSTMAGIGPIAEALGLAAARAWDFPYAQARGMGSLGFFGANLVVGGLIARTGVGIALWWIVACTAAVAVLALGHPGAHRVPGRPPPSLGGIGGVVTAPAFALLMAAVACLQASHAVMYALGSIHWRDLGIGETEIGALWAASAAAEIAFLLTVGTAIVQRGGRLGAVRRGRRAALGGDDGRPDRLLALAGAGAARADLRRRPSRRDDLHQPGGPRPLRRAAQGAAGAMAVGGVMALAMALAAAVYPLLGGRTYAIGVALSLLGLALTFGLARRWSGGALEI